MSTQAEREAFLRSLTPLTLDDLVQLAEITGLNEQLRDALDEKDAAAHEPCDSEVWSWQIYRPEQMDPYWIRCTRVGPHDEHKDSNTGATWTD